MMMNCCRKHGGQFTSHDIAIVNQCLGATIGVLLTNLTLESELRIKSHLQKLLTVAKNLFSHLGDVTVLLRQIMAEARHLTQAERCSLFLVDKKNEELVAKVFDGNILADGTTEVCLISHLCAERGLLITLRHYHHKTHRDNKAALRPDLCILDLYDLSTYPDFLICLLMIC